MTDLSANALLMIEPDREGTPSPTPVTDEVSEKLARILEHARPGATFRGFHLTRCGKRSDSCEWILPNGMITNSLAMYYIQHYRPWIPDTELRKIEYLSQDLYFNFSTHHYVNRTAFERFFFEGKICLREQNFRNGILDKSYLIYIEGHKEAVWELINTPSIGVVTFMSTAEFDEQVTGKVCRSSEEEEDLIIYQYEE